MPSLTLRIVPLIILVLVSGMVLAACDDNVAALLNTSELDANFGGTGTVTVAVGTSDDTARAVVVQSDGKIVAAGCAVIGANCKIALERYLTDGSLDATFDGDGKLTTSIGAGEDGAYAVALQADGKIVAAGATFNGTNRDVAVVRYTTSGALDTTFGGGDGICTTAVGSGTDFASGVAIQSDGKIVVAGCSVTGDTCELALVRYDTTGGLDLTFSGDGIETRSIGPGEDGAYGLAILTDSRIVIAGGTFNGLDTDILVMRFNTNGSVDTSFGGGDGICTTKVGAGNDVASAVAIQSDSKIVVAGCAVIGSNCKLVTARFTANGILDSSFAGGIIVTTVGPGEDGAYGVAIQSDSKVVVAGGTFNGTNRDFLLVRYTAGGLPDPIFGGGDGIITTAVGTGDDFANGVAIQSNGLIVAAGTAFNGTNQDFALIRYRN